MKGYITTVAAAAIMAAFADNLVPVKWQKYISLLTGAILLLTLISPLLSLRKIDIPKIDGRELEAYKYDMSDEVTEAFGKNVEADIEERLLYEMGIKADARVKVAVTDGKIAGVEEISLNCKQDSAISAMMKEVYDCGKVTWRNK